MVVGDSGEPPKSYLPLREGGKSFMGWLEHVMRSFLHSHELVAFGASAVPQIGENAGTTLSFRENVVPSFSAHDLELVETEFTKTDSREFYTFDTTVKVLHLPRSRSGDLSYVGTFLFLQNDRRIGHLWCVVPKERAEQIVPDLLKTEQFVTTAVLCEKMIISVDQLARPFWRASNSLTDLAQSAVDSCMASLGCLNAVVWIADEPSRTLRKKASKGNLPLDRALEIPFDHGVAGLCYSSGNSLVVDDLQNPTYLENNFGIHEVHNPKLISELNWRSAIFVPLDKGDRIIGVIAIYGPRIGGFSKHEATILQAFAQRLTASYVNANRLEELLKIEAQIKLEAPAIRTGLIAIRRVHDADNSLTMAQSGLSTLTSLYKHEKSSKVYTSVIAASRHVDHAHQVLKEMVSTARTFDRLRLGRKNVAAYLSTLVNRYRPDCTPHGITISSHCLGTVDFHIDENQFTRAISNIVENAIEFLQADTKGGNRRIIIEGQEENEKVAIKIKDNGPGIEPGKESEIFKLFFTTRIDKGLGFGLGIAKEIIEQHSGEITVSSIWGMETTFVVRIPKNLRE